MKFNGGNLKWLNYFAEEPEYKNYFIRFKEVFYDLDEFLSCFPKEMQGIAEEYYIPLLKGYGNWLLNATTAEQGWSLMWNAVRRNRNKWMKLKELNDLDFKTLFNNDITKTDTTRMHSKSTANSKNTNYDVNNEFVGDRDAFDDSKWKTDKYLQDGKNADATNTNKSNGKSNSSSSSINYHAQDMKTYLQIAKDADNWLIHECLRECSAPLQLDFETLNDWRGDF